MRSGIFMDGSITGISYETQTCRGKLSPGGFYNYEEGETITFFIKKMPLGSCSAKSYITTLDLTHMDESLLNLIAVNMARLLLSLGDITDEQEEIISKNRARFHFYMGGKEFEENINEALDDLGISLISIERTRNILRRCNKGILKEEVNIPLRDGRSLEANIYRPLTWGKYPVVMCMGAFGKEFYTGFAHTPEEKQHYEVVEDKYYGDYDSRDTQSLLIGTLLKRVSTARKFEGRRYVEEEDPEEGLPIMVNAMSPVFEQPNPDQWVPHGYVVIHVVEYGCGKEGVEEYQFGKRNGLDYKDAIEWAASRKWSSGKVGLYGASYYAMTQYTVAQHHPKGLTAMIPIMGDFDSYRHYVYSGGGLINVIDNSSLATPDQEYAFYEAAKDNPFFSEEAYGKDSKYMSMPDITKVDYPIWIALETGATLHTIGSSEAFVCCPSKNKKLDVLIGAGIHYWMYNNAHVSKHRRFFDYWLKGEENGIMDEPVVDLSVASGNGSYFTRFESNWPVPGTDYKKLYLDASCAGAGKDIPEKGSSISYSADVLRSKYSRVEGATFTTKPFKEDTVLSGYFKAGLYVSSNTTDMELHVTFRVFDEDGIEVQYRAYSDFEYNIPFTFGSLKVSHRVQDEKLTRDERPIYAHTKEAYSPLTPDEIVYCEVAISPTSVVIKKGWSFEIDIDPISHIWVDYREDEYRNNAVNTIYTGPEYPSFIQIPLLPKK